MDEDGNYPWDESFGCEHSDSTWYPPQCDYSTNKHLNCMVLLQFSPEPNAFDAEFSRNLILQNELPLVVKYLGKRTSKRAQENFNRFFNSTEQSRVIYQLNSFDCQLCRIQLGAALREALLSMVPIQIQHTWQLSNQTSQR